MRRWNNQYRRGFSLLELVIVVVILGIIAAIAIPRMSRGSQGASETALKHNLTIIRDALERYRAEHTGQIPAANRIATALVFYSDEAGTVYSATQTTEAYLGPYIRMPPPELPVGRRKGNKGIAETDVLGVAWIYDATTGEVRANCDNDEVDSAGTPYNQY